MQYVYKNPFSHNATFWSDMSLNLSPVRMDSLNWQNMFVTWWISLDSGHVLYLPVTIDPLLVPNNPLRKFVWFPERSISFSERTNKNALHLYYVNKKSEFVTKFFFIFNRIHRKVYANFPYLWLGKCITYMKSMSLQNIWISWQWIHWKTFLKRSIK